MNNWINPIRVLMASVFALMALFLNACGETTEPSVAAMTMPPASVSVAKVISHEVSEWRDFTGRLEASESIVVKPRTSGYVVSVDFQDGAKVKKGAQLFQIDFRTIKAEVEQLAADLKRAKAEIELTKRDLKRAESLRATSAISTEQLDNRRTLLTQAKAEADSAQADLKRAKVLFAITTVKAEFDGHVSNARVKVGGSVVAGTTVLTTLVSTDQMHAYFDVDEQTYMRLKVLAAGATVESMAAPVMMNLVGESGYNHYGNIDFVDNQLNISTGTIRLRAAFNNPKGDFTPGMFVRLKMRVGAAYESILVDEKAIGTDLNHKFVLVLGENNVVEYRSVELGPKVEGLRSIRSGLSLGDVIVVNGLQRARPGAPVSPTEIDMVTEDTLKALKKLQSSARKSAEKLVTGKLTTDNLATDSNPVLPTQG